MNILIACDKFKASLKALEVCESIAKGISENNANTHCVIQALADGGDGTAAILKDALELHSVSIDTVDPINRSIKAAYHHNKDTAYIELAEASGISHLTQQELNPMVTHCIGTGILIRKAIDDGFQKIVLCLGGSCTNEAGLSIAYALGFRFLTLDGQLIIPTGGNLSQIAHICPPEANLNIKMIILTDVVNPLYGLHGAAHIFAAQKGASDSNVILLDKGLTHIAHLLESDHVSSINNLQGGGAAGGIAAGLHVLLGATLTSGFGYLKDVLRIEDKIRQADLVITGEGYLDDQSFQGKVIGNMAAICHNMQVPLIAIVGQTDIDNDTLRGRGIVQVHQVMDFAKDKKEAMNNAAFYLEKIAANLDLHGKYAI